jgi:surface protein
MFQECKELKSLDLFKFNTENVTDMKNMFYRCIKLKEIKGINNFITYKVISMNSMFQECKELEQLDLSNFNISNVNNMENMFSGCSKLYEIKGIKKFLYKINSHIYI